MEDVTAVSRIGGTVTVFGFAPQVTVINAIKEQQAQIEELRRLVSTLEQQNKILSGQLLQLGQRAQ